MPDDENPPVRRFVLKPKEITPTETPARPGDGTAISVQLMHRQNELAEERSSLRKREGWPQSPPDAPVGPVGSPLLAPKEITPTETRACAGDGTAISARLILQDNLAAAKKLNPEIVELPHRKMSRRTRDFFLLMAAVIIALAFFMQMLPRTMGTLIMGLVITGFAGVMFAWIMFGVMDDY